MRVDIVGSIIITLVLMFICYIFNLGLFGSILLMIGAFCVLNYRTLLLGKWYSFVSRFERKQPVKKAKSPYEHMDMNE